MCTNDELKTILNEQVIPALGAIKDTVGDHGERIEKLEGDVRQVPVNQEGIAEINKKLDKLPKQISQAIDDRNLFYLGRAGRWFMSAMLILAGAMGNRILEVWF